MRNFREIFGREVDIFPTHHPFFSANYLIGGYFSLGGKAERRETPLLLYHRDLSNKVRPLLFARAVMVLCELNK